MTQGLKNYLENIFHLSAKYNKTLPLESEKQNSYWKDYIKTYKTHGFIDGYYVNYNSGIKYPLLSYNNIYFVIFINSVFRK